jgi:hypothetical protein
MEGDLFWKEIKKYVLNVLGWLDRLKREGKWKGN